MYTNTVLLYYLAYFKTNYAIKIALDLHTHELSKNDIIL